MTNEQKVIAQVIARCWRDPGYKARFLADPTTVLREAGVEVPYGTNIHVHEAGEGERHMIIPPPPSSTDVPIEAIVPMLTYYHNKPGHIPKPGGPKPPAKPKRKPAPRKAPKKTPKKSPGKRGKRR